MIGEVRCVAPTGDICGEAATWSADENRVYWVDINRFLVHRLDVESGAVTSHLFDEPVVALSLTTRDGTLLVALGSKLVLLQVETDQRQDLGVTLPSSPTVRFNDGRTDPNGVFWIGSMGNNVGPNGENLDVTDGLGKLYRYTESGSLEEVEANIGIANTLCWSPNKSYFYFGDTLKNEIRRYSFDAATSSIGEGETHFSGFERGFPDGSTIDADGYIWNCRFGGGCVVRVAPDGSMDRIIEMPVKNVTTCCFGGDDLSTLYITTASVMKDEGDRLAGSLFAIKTQTRGLPENRFKL
jgi:sugar lactone lactonase YvrE